MIRFRRRWSPKARTARWIAAGLVCALSAYSFLFQGTGREIVPRIIPAWQFIPSAMRLLAIAAGTASILAGVLFLVLLLVSVIFGRWYCSFLCPLGFLQDLASLVGKTQRGYKKPLNMLRVVAFGSFIGGVAAGGIAIASWIEPWSIFGRFMTYDIQPLARLLFRIDAPSLPPALIIASGLAMSCILIVSVIQGRWFCNSLCPTGSLLGFLNTLAPFRLRLDEHECVACGRCTLACSSSCIDGSRKHLDATRCVYCLDCVAQCPAKAITYGLKKNVSNLPQHEAKAMSRSAFIAANGAAIGAVIGSAVIGGAAIRSVSATAISHVKNGSPQGLESPMPLPVSPPGSISVGRFAQTCTACGLCIAGCPAKILRPSTGQFGLAGLFAPLLDYDVSYCQFSCTLCMDLCPSGALQKMSVEHKHRTKIGDASLIQDLCIVIKNGTKCGACAEHCPTGAVRMVVGSSGLPEPVFSSAICIGCGACHHACPVKPEKAITVSGLAKHEIAEKPSETLFNTPTPTQSDTTDLFPF